MKNSQNYRTPKKFKLRLPSGLREQLAALATVNQRSLNFEIQHRISALVPSEPAPTNFLRTSGRADDQYLLRMPDRLHQELQAAAENNARSMNSEMLHRILWSLAPDADLDFARDRIANLTLGVPTRSEPILKDGPAHGAGISEIFGVPTTFDVKAAIADKAKAIVTGARRSAYGTPEDNFERIARFWQAYFENTGRGTAQVTAADVSPLMRLMKEARLCETPDHLDSFVDLVGYALTGAEMNGLKAEDFD